MLACSSTGRYGPLKPSIPRRTHRSYVKSASHGTSIAAACACSCVREGVRFWAFSPTNTHLRWRFHSKSQETHTSRRSCTHAPQHKTRTRRAMELTPDNAWTRASVEAARNAELTRVTEYMASTAGPGVVVARVAEPDTSAAAAAAKPAGTRACGIGPIARPPPAAGVPPVPPAREPRPPATRKSRRAARPHPTTRRHKTDD